MAKTLNLSMTSLVTTALLSVTLLSGCATTNPLEGSIVIEGSSTVYPISEAVAEEFSKKFPNVEISIAGLGSSTAFAGLLAGTADIGNASRKVKTTELDSLTAANIHVQEVKLGDDGITIVVPKTNTWMTDITVEELKSLWINGSTVDSWDDVRSSWPAQPIQLFGPGAESGTLEFFREVILGKDLSGAYNAVRSDYTPSEDDNVLVTGVKGNTYALGFFGYAYYAENIDDLKAVPVINKGATTAITPSIETISNGTYLPLSRPLFMYVNLDSYKNNEAVREFVNYFLSEEATGLVDEVGYSGLEDSAYADALATLKETLE